ncbi:transglutaminase-like domain-containing protein [Oceanirhabdus sp. W0125-5]|uniref:transglutaminase-like domain-containing protein n=1 Tax=Oceanirhabdus sp. W0125-5 TaxID=2999116 RepID=UPI0022F2C89A|nr:transglutaminase-like domain-containing protein [Oceanirhabdus sp. W0125-5]WBW98796.1 transglutaminase-like domain-containing protein [Oceanirhabdus sp. W0125-5]
MKRYLEAFLGVLVFFNIAIIGFCYVEYYDIQEIVFYELFIGVLSVYLIQRLVCIIVNSKWKIPALITLFFLFQGLLLFKGSEILGRLLRVIEECHILYDKYYYSEVIIYTEFRWAILFFASVITLCIATLAFNIKRNSLIYFDMIIAVVLWYQNGTQIIKKYLIIFIMIGTIIYMVDKLIPVLKDFKRNRDTSLMAWSIIMAVIIGITVRLIPAKIYGNDIFGLSGFVDNKYAPVKGKFKISYSDVYRYSDSIKDGKNKLGGKINQESKKIILVKGEDVQYLKSFNKSLYDGAYWFNTSTSYKKLKDKKMDWDDLKNFEKIESEIIEIKYEDGFITRSIFTPGFSEEFFINDRIYYDENSTSILKSDEKADKYKVKKIQLKSKATGVILAEKFSDLKKESMDDFKYSIPCEIIRNNNKDAELSYLYMQIEGYNGLDDKTMINNLTILKEYEEYLALPQSISDRVYDLTYEIIDGANSSYEKINRIRNYLKETFPYTLDVSEVPDEHEFVDYFIFEEKKGYCTYFATAMAVMGRIAGIPTRYCEGFKIDYSNTFYIDENTESQSKFFVKTDNAHAWTEVLVDPEDDIWIVVEATASEEAEVEISNIERAEVNPAKGRDRLEDFLNFGDINDELGERNNIVQKKDKDNSFILYLILRILLALILLKLIYDTYKRLSIKNSKSPSKIYYYALKRLKRVKINKDISESEIEFSKKIANPELRKIMMEIVRLGYEESYGIENEYSSKEHYKGINRYIRESLGVFVDTIIRVVLGE